MKTNDHYFSEKPTSAFGLFQISCHLRGTSFKIFSAPGIFSSKRIDKGTIVLVEYCQIKDKEKMLDLGCGNGAAGISLALSFPHSSFTLVDINERALRVAKKNVLYHKLDNVTVKKSDVYSSLHEETFDVILLNPPQTAGKELCFRMIDESKKHLVPGGSLQLVARHNKGGKSLSAKMQDVFGNVATLAKKSGYHVYMSRNQ